MTRSSLLFALLLTSGLSACGRSSDDRGGGSGVAVIDRVTASASDRWDVLVVVDDSASMASRQADVSRAVGSMIRRLAVPACLDGGRPVEPEVWVDELGRCPAGLTPEREALRTMNVGVITTSLDAPGVDGCVNDAGQLASDRGDAGHLRTRALDGREIPTWQNRGFYVWDRDQTRTCEPWGGRPCPGIGDADDLASKVEAVVAGVGTTGCGTASPLEAAWRFLGDPAPYARVIDGNAEGVDDALLAERAAFLGEDDPYLSRLIVVVVSDGDDSSFRADAIGAYFARPDAPMPRARVECTVDPGSECCASCIENVPDGCSGDGECAAPGCTDPVQCPDNFYPAGSPENDPTMRCVDGRRRFGIDGCYPTARYVNAFTANNIDPDRLDLSAGDSGGPSNPLVQRLASLVSIVDVPWEAIARRDASGVPDLVDGLVGDSVRGGYMDAGELERSGAWDRLLAGDGGTAADAPRRILEVARGIGGDAWLSSLEPPTFDASAAGRRLDVGFEATLQGIADEPRSVDVMLCPTEQVTEGEGVVCGVVEAWNSDGDGNGTTTDWCSCAGAGRADVDSEAWVEAVRDQLEVEAEASGWTVSYDCFCLVPRVEGRADELGTPAQACAQEEVPPVGVDGWCIASADRDGDLATADTRCGQEPEAIRLVGRGLPRPGASAYLVCE